MRGTWTLAAAAVLGCATLASGCGSPSGARTPSAPADVRADSPSPPPMAAETGGVASGVTPSAAVPIAHAEEAPPIREATPRVDPQVALLGMDDEHLGELIDDDIEHLGTVSAGKPNGGALLNGVQLEESSRWEIVDPRRAFATQETLDYLRRAVDEVHAQFPTDTHPMFVGHLSREGGGRLWPHRSHQSGRDVDLGYYYQAKYAEWYRPATPHTLDRPRTWAFVKALLSQTDVEYIFISTRVQMLLKEYALEIGEDPDWLDTVFEFRSRNPEPIIRHTYGHRTHMHVRFFNPKAQGVGIRAYDLLAKRRLISPRVRLQPYLARPGDSYAKLAKLAGHSARVLERTNRDEALQAGQLIAVPIRGTVQRVERLEVPRRRLPPRAATMVTGVAGPSEGG